MTCHRMLSLVAILAALPAISSAQAVIEGRVTLPKSRAAPVMNKRYGIVTEGGILSTNPPLAVVYLEGSFPGTTSPPTAQMAQKELEFPNFDDTYHNIFSYSPAKRFDLGRYRRDEQPVPAQRFDTPGLVVLRCDIHEHMRALILVLETPYFVLTDAEGHYRLGGLPAGRHTLKVWLDSKTTLERPVELQADSTLRVDFP